MLDAVARGHGVQRCVMRPNAAAWATPPIRPTGAPPVAARSPLVEPDVPDVTDVPGVPPVLLEALPPEDPGLLPVLMSAKPETTEVSIVTWSRSSLAWPSISPNAGC